MPGRDPVPYLGAACIARRTCCRTQGHTSARCGRGGAGSLYLKGPCTGRRGAGRHLEVPCSIECPVPYGSFHRPGWGLLPASGVGQRQVIQIDVERGVHYSPAPSSAAGAVHVLIAVAPPPGLARVAPSRRAPTAAHDCRHLTAGSTLYLPYSTTARCSTRDGAWREGDANRWLGADMSLTPTLQ